MQIHGKWYTETEAAAYIARLEKGLAEALAILNHEVLPVNFRTEEKIRGLNGRFGEEGKR